MAVNVTDEVAHGRLGKALEFGGDKPKPSPFGGHWYTVAMKASAKSVAEILETRGQFIIPFFQRHYSWEQRQWRRLWNDLLRLLDDAPRPDSGASVHFLGPLVTITHTNTPGSLPTWQVIDGQQRLTTLTLLLAALRDVFLERKGESQAAEIMDTCLINPHKGGLERYKVVTRVGDREVLERIVEGKPPDAPAGSRLAGGVKFFTERIRGHVARDAGALERLKVAATARLSLVTITLEGENPYEIFESLNATGLPLEESDLIRNYLFMQVPLDKQEEFQDRRWSKLEQAFAGRKDARGVPTEFYRAFCMRNGTYSKQKQTYLDFRTEYQSSIDSPEAAVDQLIRFAGFDAWVHNPLTVPSRSLRDRLFQLTLLDTSTARPLVLHLLDRHGAGTLSDETLLGCLDDLVSFLLRRSLCGESTRQYSKWLVEAIGAITPEDPRGALQRYYARRGWPGDKAFIEAVTTLPIYQREPGKARLILEGLEATLNPAEQIEDAGVSIEHVLPRTLGDGISGDAWRAVLGPEWEAEHGRLVHVIGNLSLTGANSDMGNRDFETKRAILRDSRFLLNREVARATVWNVQAIEARSRDLAERAAAIWTRPTGTPDGRGPGKDKRSRTETKRFKADYWAAVLPALEQLAFVTEVPQARTFGLVGLPLTRKAFRYGLRPRFQKRRLSLLLFLRGPERERNFDALIAERVAIENVVGERLVWRKSVPWSKATSVIELVGEGLDPNDPATLEGQKAWFLQGLERFHAAFHDRCVALAPGDEPRKMTPTRLKRQRWWTQVLEALAAQSALFAGRRPPAETWIGEGCGIRGLQYTMGAAKAHSSSELYIDRGRKGRDENKQIFAILHGSRAEIEAAFGGPLEWQPLDDKRACRICWMQQLGYSLPEETWARATAAQADAIARLAKAIEPFLDTLKTTVSR